MGRGGQRRKQDKRSGGKGKPSGATNGSLMSSSCGFHVSGIARSKNSILSEQETSQAAGGSTLPTVETILTVNGRSVFDKCRKSLFMVLEFAGLSGLRASRGGGGIGVGGEGRRLGAQGVRVGARRGDSVPAGQIAVEEARVQARPLARGRDWVGVWASSQAMRRSRSSRRLWTVPDCFHGHSPSRAVRVVTLWAKRRR